MIYRNFIETAHEHEALAIVAADLLSFDIVDAAGENLARRRGRQQPAVRRALGYGDRTRLTSPLATLQTPDAGASGRRV